MDIPLPFEDRHFGRRRRARLRASRGERTASVLLPAADGARRTRAPTTPGVAAGAVPRGGGPLFFNPAFTSSNGSVKCGVTLVMANLSELVTVEMYWLRSFRDCGTTAVPTA